MKMKHK
jgi:transposase-like protein